MNNNPRRFVACPATECGITIAERSNGGSYRRSVPTIRGPILPWITEALKPRIGEIVIPPPALVVKLHDATVNGPGTTTVSGDKIVLETLINAHGTKKL